MLFDYSEFDFYLCILVAGSYKLGLAVMDGFLEFGAPHIIC